MTTRECIHLVTGGYFRSHNEDNGYASLSAVAENAIIIIIIMFA